MSTVTERERLDLKSNTPMAHLRVNDGLIALCGTKIKGIPAGPGTDLCVVCMELAPRAMRW